MDSRLRHFQNCTSSKRTKRKRNSLWQCIGTARKFFLDTLIHNAYLIWINKNRKKKKTTNDQINQVHKDRLGRYAGIDHSQNQLLTIADWSFPLEHSLFDSILQHRLWRTLDKMNCVHKTWMPPYLPNTANPLFLPCNRGRGSM